MDAAHPSGRHLAKPVHNTRLDKMCLEGCRVSHAICVLTSAVGMY